MISILSPTPPRKEIEIAGYVLDVVLSFGLAVLTFASFVALWTSWEYFFVFMAVCAVGHFVAGLLRGRSRRNLILQAVCISLASLLLTALVNVRPIRIPILVGTFGPAAAGLCVRRYLSPRRDNAKEES